MFRTDFFGNLGRLVDANLLRNVDAFLERNLDRHLWEKNHVKVGSGFTRSC